MNIQGCLLSPDQIDKILIASQLDPKHCSFHLMDKSKKSLGKVWVQIHDGQVYLVVERSACLDQPVYAIPLATL